MANVAEFTDSNFQDEVLNSPLPVVVDFWAVWCGPCRMISPIIDELSNEYSGKVKFGKVDIDANPEIAIKYGIRGIPIVMVFSNGEAVEKQVGASPRGTYAGLIDKYVGAAA